MNLILINKIKIFAASISTLVAFFSMFIIRYIDVNKTVHMRIRKPIIIGSILIGTMLISALARAENAFKSCKCGLPK